MGFLLFVVAMAGLCIMSTTKESRAQAIKDGEKYRWVWLINIALIASLLIPWDSVN